MYDFSGLVCVPIITMTCYCVIEIYKYAINYSDKYERFIPLISGFFGLIMGVVGFYFANEILKADSILSAILIGLTSGLAATGTHQIFKQATKPSNNSVQNQIDNLENLENQNTAQNNVDQSENNNTTDK